MPPRQVGKDEQAAQEERGRVEEQTESDFGNQLRHKAIEADSSEEKSTGEVPCDEDGDSSTDIADPLPKDGCSEGW